MSSFLLHQFSPQRTDPLILKETLVSRNGLLDEVLDKIRRSASTAAQHHFLLIGPRGIGKTNFLTLVQHELSQDTAGAPNLRLAWLNEDEVSATFLLLLRRIYRALASAYPEEYPQAALEAIQGQSQEVALMRLTDALITAAAGHKILILVENLDEHFGKMKLVEQKRWRAFLQNHKEFVTLASAQKLTAEVAKREKPFFNFFDVRILRPLTVEEAKELLIRIATLRKGAEDPRFIRFLETPRGLGRLRAIHTLAGGNPRLYVLLSELLTAEDLDDVVNAFEEMVDRQLTTYYQERLRWISGQQQEIIHELCRARVPISVNRIAQGIFATNQTVSRQLKELSQMGYVESHSLGRESVYELSEPLMRLVLEAKQGSGRGRLKLIVEFLRLWFEPEELRQKLELSQSDVSKSYLEEALRGMSNIAKDIDWSQVPKKVHELGQRLTTEQNPERRIQGFTRMLEMPGLPKNLGAVILAWRAVEKLILNDIDGAFEDADGAIQSQAAPSAMRAELYLARSTAYLYRGDREHAISDLTEAIRIADPLKAVELRIQRAELYLEQGDTTAAEVDLNEVLQIPDLSTELKAKALLVRAQVLGAPEASSEAVSVLDRLLQLETLTPEQRWRATFDRAQTLRKSDENAALEGFTQALERAVTPGQRASALVVRADIYEKNGDRASAAQDLDLAINLSGVPEKDRVHALLRRATFHSRSGQYDLALTDADQALEGAKAGSTWAFFSYQARGLLHETMGNAAEALADYNSALDCKPSAVTDLKVVRMQRQGLALQRGHLLLRLSRVSEAKASLDQVLDAYVEGPFVDGGAYRQALDILFAQEPGSSLGTIQKLVSVAATAGELGWLGAALVHQLSSFRSSKSSPNALIAWEEAWTKAGADHQGLIMPLRLLLAGLRYLAEPHEKYLLDLALEERQLLQETLGLTD